MTETIQASDDHCSTSILASPSSYEIKKKETKAKVKNVGLCFLGASCLAGIIYFLGSCSKPATPETPQQDREKERLLQGLYNLVINDIVEEGALCLPYLDRCIIRECIEYNDEQTGISAEDIRKARETYQRVSRQLHSQGKKITDYFSQSRHSELFTPEPQTQGSHNPLRNINPRAYRTLEREVADYNHGRRTGIL